MSSRDAVRWLSFDALSDSDQGVNVHHGELQSVAMVIYGINLKSCRRLHQKQKDNETTRSHLRYHDLLGNGRSTGFLGRRLNRHGILEPNRGPGDIEVNVSVTGP